MKLTETHQTALQDILTWRRDMRHFRPDPLPEAELDHLRAAMDCTPSVGNARPWRVLQVRDPGLRARVRADFERCNGAAAKTYDDRDRAEYLRLKLAGLDQAPEHLAIFTETAPDEGRGLGRRTMPQTLEHSTAMAIHALWLMARARNIGVGMLSIIDPEAMCRLFGVPDTWRFTAYLCVGYPEFDDDTPLLHRKGWQRNKSTRWVIR
ncbi:5,6-dimethylbenzimidazole synthase [Primorskyibacter aestuariivivens]|uniref:5,6-dimethylbenzimidazole synthase n=1 Tax=Primorskyibacter aestuariivivens TaxID=1888912 RepID=UPI002300653F|nr:5,6-dimethylbenzimidazole synthase [Primorskyibacter aestuariivivens]MDA7428008.1 5,6-dimethylbenzimidazole synthase [Primorskyibacter aestuariivivens]